VLESLSFLELTKILLFRHPDLPKDPYVLLFNKQVRFRLNTPPLQMDTLNSGCLLFLSHVCVCVCYFLFVVLYYVIVIVLLSLLLLLLISH